MTVLLCASSERMATMWKDNLRAYQTMVISDEATLMQALTDCTDTAILLLEKEWVHGDVKALLMAIAEWYEQTQVFFLTQTPSFLEGRQLLEHGIKGYGNSRMQQVHMEDAIKTILEKNTWLYPEFVQQMIHLISKPKKFAISKEEILSVLSPREVEVAMLIYEGLSNREIADTTGITLRTVKAHSSAIYEKFHVKDRVSLVLHLKSLH